MNGPATENPTIFRPFSKMPRLNREVIITEKIDGTNAQIVIAHRAVVQQCFHEGTLNEVGPDYATPDHIIAQQGDYVLLAGSRTRWIRPKQPGEKGDPDNYGFAAWVSQNAIELFKLGEGRHFGEWFGSGINRAYGLTNGERRFALFNTGRWAPVPGRGPWLGAVDKETGFIIECCTVVPVLWQGCFDKFDVDFMLSMLREHGSFAAEGFKNPEGIVIFHTASQSCYKVTLENDESPKSLPSLTNPQQLAAGVEAAQEAFAQRFTGHD